ncbi:MAG: hypothetical protein O7J95_06900 [Planctomycetota bacterium]|nr:hypothetical protein [Planctomycetota bacterium]
MKYFGPISVGIVIVFWIVMNSLLVWRDVETRKLEGYQRGVTNFLRNDLRRERWLGIYRKDESRHRKVGYSGFTLEKSYVEDGVEYLAFLETLFRGKLPFQGFFSKRDAGSVTLRLTGEMVLDQDLRPKKVHIDLALQLPGGQELRIVVKGKRVGERVLLKVLHGESQLLEIPLPLEALALSDGFIPALPVAGFKVGDSYRIRIFDPLALGSEAAAVTVVEQRTEEVEGVLVDVYELETRWRGNRMRSLVTANGEVVRHELGALPGIVLMHETSREQAMKGLTP